LRLGYVLHCKSDDAFLLQPDCILTVLSIATHYAGISLCKGIKERAAAADQEDKMMVDLPATT